MKKRKLIVILALLLAAALPGFAQSLSMQAQNLVSSDEQFTVAFVFEGESKPSNFQWTPPSEFQLVWGPQQSTSTSISFVNGKKSQSTQLTYTYILLPKSTGVFTLPGASATVKGEKISCEGRKIEVVAASSSKPSQSSQSSSSSSQPSSSREVSDNDIFMKLSLSRTNVVLGEPVTAVLKLYTRADVRGFEGAKLPSFNGFWSQDITPDGDIQFARENVDGHIYNAAVIKKYVLIPQQSGKLSIDPSELICLISVRVSGGGNSIFDGFFDHSPTIRKRVTAPALAVNVAALPSPAPASFSGGVGKFSLSAKLTRDSLKTHEAASLIVTVSGKGNISLLEAPKVNFPHDIEVYDTKTKEKSDKSTGGTSGSKTYEFPFIPRSYGDFTIEPIKYSYYDVTSGKYVTLESEPLEFHVERGNESEPVVTSSGIAVPSVNKKGVANLGEDIRFISTKVPDLRARGSFFVDSGAFKFLSIFLAALAVALYFAFRKIAERRADVAGARTRGATKMARRRLKDAAGYLSKDLYTAFYESLHKALLGFAGDKLSMSSAELSKDNLSENLSAAGVPGELVSEFIGLLDACEYARYAPVSGHEAMQAHYDKAENVISMMDSKIRKTAGAKSVTAVVALLLMLLPASRLSAADTAYTDSLWVKATAEYTAGQWAAAAEDYAAIENLGLVSRELYTNLGNAFFKDGFYGKAILNYERALKLDPSYGDARFNLSVAQGFVQDDIEAVPEFIFKTWTRKLCYMLPGNTWAVVFLVFFALALAMALLFLLGSSSAARRTGFFTALAALLLAFGALGFSLSQRNDSTAADEAIVMKPVVAVKSSPGADSSKDLFILHEGTKVTLIDSVGGWYNVELSDGRQGWVELRELEII
ncbi:MAG: BatD family protein [Bacteroidales bacterium]|nr:BatD family protein [Bacteroidales bacterium]